MGLRKIFLALPLVFLAGCVTSNHEYTPPSSSLSAAPNSKTVDKSRDEVWNKLVTELSSQFFVINNLDKPSGFINISYSGDPERYVDGGQLDYKVSDFSGPREYRFPAAQANTEYESFENGHLYAVTRNLKLEGRMNVLVSEISPTKTQITIHTRYVLILRLSGREAGYLAVVNPLTTITFDTGEEGRTPGGTIFRPTGELEASVLNLVK